MADCPRQIMSWPASPGRKRLYCYLITGQQSVIKRFSKCLSWPDCLIKLILAYSFLHFPSTFLSLLDCCYFLTHSSSVCWCHKQLVDFFRAYTGDSRLQIIPKTIVDCRLASSFFCVYEIQLRPDNSSILRWLNTLFGRRKYLKVVLHSYTWKVPLITETFLG